MLFSISYVLYVSIWNWVQIKVWKVGTFVLIICQKKSSFVCLFGIFLAPFYTDWMGEEGGWCTANNTVWKTWWDRK